jgi:hypothetical protein
VCRGSGDKGGFGMRSAREAGRTPSRSAFAQFNYVTIPVILRGGSRKFFASNRCAYTGERQREAR